MAPVVSASFRLWGVPRTQAFLRRWSNPVEGTSPSAEVRGRLVAAAYKTHSVFHRYTTGKVNCLVRSLSLWALLRRRGLDGVVRVGFRRRDGKLEGHAWLEYEGMPLNESAAEVATYTVMEASGSYDFPMPWRKP